MIEEVEKCIKGLDMLHKATFKKKIKSALESPEYLEELDKLARLFEACGYFLSDYCRLLKQKLEEEE